MRRTTRRSGPAGAPTGGRAAHRAPASDLPDGPAWPEDDQRGTRSFVTRVSQPDHALRRVSWPRDVPAPASAPAYALTDHLSDLVARADRLARALGLDPAVRSGTRGTLRYEGADDAVLVVATDAGQEWTYARDGARCTDVDGTETASLLAECARIDDQESPAGVTRPDGKVTRQGARPVLAAVGFDVDATRAAVTDGGRLLYVDPSVAGHTTRGLPTGVLVDGDGVRAATGWLGEATPVASYEVRSLSDLVAPDGVAAGGLRCASPAAAPECAQPAAQARGVRLGYAPWWFGDSLRLVPVWLADDDRARLLDVLPAVSIDLLPTSYRQRFAR